MKTRIEIETKTFIRFWLVLFGFAFALFVIYMSRSALVILGSALFLAIALNFPVKMLTKYMPGSSRIAATSSAFVLVIAAIAMVIFLVIPPIAEQTAKLVDAIPRMVSEASKQWSAFGRIVEQYHIQPQVDSAIKSLQDDSAKWAASFGGNVVSGIGTIASNGVSVMLTLVISFLMLVEGPVWMRHMWALYGDKEKMHHHRNVLMRMNTAVSGYVSGQLAMSGIGAVVSGIIVFVTALFAPDVPNNLALPAVAIMFLLSLVPMFGTTIGAFIIAVLLALNSVSAAIIYLVVFFLYQQVENNVIYPAVQSRFVEMSPLTILVSVTVGLYLFGLAGGIISIPVAGCIKVLVEEYLMKHNVQYRAHMESLAAEHIEKAKKKSRS